MCTNFSTINKWANISENINCENKYYFFSSPGYISSHVVGLVPSFEIWTPFILKNLFVKSVTENILTPFFRKVATFVLNLAPKSPTSYHFKVWSFFLSTTQISKTYHSQDIKDIRNLFLHVIEEQIQSCLYETPLLTTSC